VFLVTRRATSAKKENVFSALVQQFPVPVFPYPNADRHSGYYRYKRGDVFTDRQKKPVEGKKDYGTIYAVFYDNHDAEGNSIVLYGDNVQTSPQVVAIAKVPDIDDTPEWTHFDLDFVYKKEVDAQKLRNMGYVAWPINIHLYPPGSNQSRVLCAALKSNPAKYAWRAHYPHEMDG
jgi:hypothetical protein